MSANLRLARTLIIAPHPDDEAIATGGLIQHVIASGGMAHVAFVTNGESNVWPQRYMERRWRITAADQRRWGAMRREEAQASLRKLGLDPSAGTFLGFPDEHLSRLLHTGDLRLRGLLEDLIRSFRPSLIVSPSGYDLHADHRAISWFAHAALERVRNSTSDRVPDIVTYVVHGRIPEVRRFALLELTDTEQRKKREAIECHRSQLVLSGPRFLSSAQPIEAFYRDEAGIVRPDSRMKALACSVAHVRLVLAGAAARTASRAGER